MSTPLLALAEYYGERFAALDSERQAALGADVALMVQEEDLTPRVAVQTLDHRIGNSLEAYADCVVIEYRGGNLRG